MSSYSVHHNGQGCFGLGVTTYSFERLDILDTAGELSQLHYDKAKTAFQGQQA
mgnify:FL=1